MFANDPRTMSVGCRFSLCSSSDFSFLFDLAHFPNAIPIMTFSVDGFFFVFALFVLTRIGEQLSSDYYRRMRQTNGCAWKTGNLFEWALESPLNNRPTLRTRIARENKQLNQYKDAPDSFNHRSQPFTSRLFLIASHQASIKTIRTQQILFRVWSLVHYGTSWAISHFSWPVLCVNSETTPTLFQTNNFESWHTSSSLWKTCTQSWNAPIWSRDFRR